MKSTVIGSAAVLAAALGIGLCGCGADAGPPGVTPTANVSAPAPDNSALNATIAGYIQRNGIVETRVRRGDPGSPTVTLPVPEGWRPAGDESPEWAYDAIVYAGPDAGGYKPSVVAVMSKLTGNVDPATIIALAPGELQNLPGYQAVESGAAGTFAGYQDYLLGGTWVQDARTKVVTQRTVVIPGSDGLYVLQLNGDALAQQAALIDAATAMIDQQTTITP
ncbi:MAG: LpqN/LpqT family lipoprotein [Actinobacteria bacterium]|nr:LpqN/LpqT family lipoprotein [Actinomycetota bacterium]